MSDAPEKPDLLPDTHLHQLALEGPTVIASDEGDLYRVDIEHVEDAAERIIASDEKAVKEGKYGDSKIETDALGNEYEPLNESGDVKAKVWEGDDGSRRLYLRVRDHDDGRRFDEYSIDVGTDAGSSGGRDE
ncbi:hypothetical protein [Halocalculus aciditolerans]|uniref:Uncharacterized protein n=1 Tax=Halocalculus aciditolerans TaxID=1383812 RepID=A0A830FLD2_9EURY|nr:hypothetical protein [Halocalculus aciditolerans]GGL57759.1 hypothetical protein GCM10009039_14930 [Halocalculus aciditolerans]